MKRKWRDALHQWCYGRSKACHRILDVLDVWSSSSIAKIESVMRGLQALPTKDSRVKSSSKVADCPSEEAGDKCVSC